MRARGVLKQLAGQRGTEEHDVCSELDKSCFTRWPCFDCVVSLCSRCRRAGGNTSTTRFGCFPTKISRMQYWPARKKHLFRARLDTLLRQRCTCVGCVPSLPISFLFFQVSCFLFFSCPTTFEPVVYAHSFDHNTCVTGTILCKHYSSKSSFGITDKT